MSSSGSILQSSRVLQESLFVYLWVGRKNTVMCSSSKGRPLLAGIYFDQLYLY